MTEKDIQRAAINNISCSSLDIGTFLENIGRECFIEGARWRVNSFWHNSDKKPKPFCDLLLIELTNGEFELGYELDATKAKRWSFIKDLLPVEK